jgi:hypothetical protein
MLTAVLLDVIYLYAKVGYDQDNKQLTKGQHIQMVSCCDCTLGKLARQIRLVSLPTYLTICCF